MRKIVILVTVFLYFLSACLYAAEKDWNEEKETHFIIYYKNAHEDFVERVIEMAEEYYNSIIEDIGFNRYDNFWLWDNRAKIYIYDSKEDYTSSTGQPAWAGGHVSQGKVIRTFPWASGFFDTLLPHELGHIIFRELIGYRNDIPAWIDEGVACYQERARRWGSSQQVKRAMEDGTFISFDRLHKLNPYKLKNNEMVDIFYAEAVSVVTFLMEEYGRERFKKFIRLLKESKSLNDALDSAYYDFKNFDDLGEKWEKYIRRLR